MGRTKNFYSYETKMKAIEMKMSGQYSNREIMEELGIVNDSQIRIWMMWYRKGEMYRFSQPIGKQYSFGKGPEELTEMEQLRRENQHLQIHLEILKKVQGNRKELVPEVVLELVEELKSKYTISTICDYIGVPRATYYRWKKQGARKIRELDLQIIEICNNHKFRVGYRTVKAWLKKDYNVKVNRNTVQRIMQKYNLQCRVKPKRKVKFAGESNIVVPNRLERDFKASKPNEKWVTDITYLPFGQSMMYLSSIMDLYNNEIIAYRISLNQDVTLVLDTLRDAVKNQNVEGVILHSDQGAQYTSYAFQNLAKEKGIITSMSRKGNCLDNAVIESFHSTLKSEEFYSQPREYLTNPIVVEKVENFIYYYNQIRLQAKLNYLSPIEYRKQVA
ncbi:IS3 family transposase [Bacillus sp. 1P02SD]|uniref:IS3 family transposase n=1 Tax=Bacillus sp. 1P02SD TaxID=3132264 RepID=UPI0039A0603E